MKHRLETRADAAKKMLGTRVRANRRRTEAAICRRSIEEGAVRMREELLRNLYDLFCEIMPRMRLDYFQTPPTISGMDL
ncbi:hypothetical protein TSUD_362420 [Trifolium subterraneum]|uniref:Uncharacterized protein n=1 Tax=Trifolium subterraneum TaxID=3900 RepID=A0A2Z6NIY4_TRISU|nr:hypothetical protein TSUD_362420 [Trifolium subterraneum]